MLPSTTPISVAQYSQAEKINQKNNSNITFKSLTSIFAANDNEALDKKTILLTRLGYGFFFACGLLSALGLLYSDIATHRDPLKLMRIPVYILDAMLMYGGSKVFRRTPGLIRPDD